MRAREKGTVRSHQGPSSNRYLTGVYKGGIDIDIYTFTESIRRRKSKCELFQIVKSLTYLMLIP